MIGLVVLLALPYLVRGPVLIADDYIWLRNAHFGGWFAAGGTRALSRPGELLGTNVLFGLIGPHPVILYLMQTVLWIIAALAVLGCLRRLVDERIALLVTMLWLWTPNHASLEHWFSTWQAWTALALLAFGVSKIIDGSRARRVPVAGILLVAASISFYELTAAAALAAVVVVPWCMTGRPQGRTTFVGLVACGTAISWSLFSGTTYPAGTSGSLTASWVLSGQFSLGFGPWTAIGRLLAVAVAALVLGMLFGALRHPDQRSRRSIKLLLLGLGTVVLGIAPLVNFQTNFYGLYDRSNTVSSVGVAMVLVAIVLWLRDLARARQGTNQHPAALTSGVRLAALGLVLLVGGCMRLGWNRTYHRQGTDASRIVRDMSGGMGQSPIRVDKRTADGPQFEGLIDGWNATAALQLHTGDANAVVWVVDGCLAIGPPVERPRAAYGTAPYGQRMHDCRAASTETKSES